MENRKRLLCETKTIVAGATETFCTIYACQYKKTVGLVSSDSAFTFICNQGHLESEMKWSCSGDSETDLVTGKHVLMWDILQGPSWVSFRVKNTAVGDDDYTVEAFGEN